MEAGKVLALDWGSVRWGWALSDLTQTLAGRSGVYLCQNPEADFVFLKQLIRAYCLAATVPPLRLRQQMMLLLYRIFLARQ